MDPVYELLTKDEMTIVKEHCKAVREGSDKKWPEARKRLVAKLYEKIRGNGYRLVGQYPSGSPKFAAIQKSAVQMIMDLSDEDYRLYRAGKIKFFGGRMQRTEASCQ